MLTPSEMEIISSGKSYVYAYYRPNGNPFYIGKGRNERCLSHLSDALNGKFDHHNRIKSGILRNIIKSQKLPKIKILVVGKSSYCNNIEKKLISYYGRMFDKSGILSNICEGGNGGSVAGRLGALKVQEGYLDKHFEEILTKARKALIDKYGPDAHKIIMSKGMKKQKLIYGKDYNKEMQRRSKLGNSSESVFKKKITRIKKHGSLEKAFEVEQAKRIKTMNERGGWSVKCYNTQTDEVLVVKKSEFDENENLVGMTSKLVPENIRQNSKKKKRYN